MSSSASCAHAATLVPRPLRTSRLDSGSRWAARSQRNGRIRLSNRLKTLHFGMLRQVPVEIEIFDRPIHGLKEVGIFRHGMNVSSIA